MKFFLCLILLSSSIALDLKYLIPVDQAKGFLLLSQEEVNALTAPAKQEIFEKTPSTLILNEKIRGQFEFDLWPPQKHQIPESWIRLPEGYASKDPLLIDLPESVQQIQINSLISPFQMLSGEQSMRLETGIYPIFSQPLNLSLASIETSTNYPLIEPEPLWEADHTLHLMASEISIDSKITISLPAGELTSLALGHFESKYLEKIELMPFQPLEIQGNRLRWAQPVRQNFEIHLFMRMPREDTMNVALPFVQATGVRNHLYVQPEEGIEFSGFSSGISTMASDRYDLAYDLQDQKEIVLRSRQLAFAPTAGPLIQDLKISTILCTLNFQLPYSPLITRIYPSLQSGHLPLTKCL